MNIQKCKSNDERNFIANITYLCRLFELIQLNESRILQRNDDVFFLSSTRRIFLVGLNRFLVGLNRFLVSLNRFLLS